MKKPDFIVVGGAKCGTTSLFHYLNQHPQIYIPEMKECRFFSGLRGNYRGLGAEKFINDRVSDWEEYQGLFLQEKDVLCGDFSTEYLYYYKNSIANIIKHLGNEVKIIILLRNPVDRAYSNYLHHIRDLTEDLTFEEALAAEEERIAENWAWGYHYFKAGLYFEAVKSYLENFKKVKIFLYEDFKNPNNLVTDILQYLEVSVYHSYDFSIRYNQSGSPRNILIQKFLLKESGFKKALKNLFPETIRRSIKKKALAKNLNRPMINTNTKAVLTMRYQNDVIKLQNLINRNLSNWILNEDNNS